MVRLRGQPVARHRHQSARQRSRRPHGKYVVARADGCQRGRSGGQSEWRHGDARRWLDWCNSSPRARRTITGTFTAAMAQYDVVNAADETRERLRAHQRARHRREVRRAGGARLRRPRCWIRRPATCANSPRAPLSTVPRGIRDASSGEDRRADSPNGAVVQVAVQPAGGVHHAGRDHAAGASACPNPRPSTTSSSRSRSR